MMPTCHSSIHHGHGTRAQTTTYVCQVISREWCSLLSVALQHGALVHRTWTGCHSQYIILSTPSPYMFRYFLMIFYIISWIPYIWVTSSGHMLLFKVTHATSLAGMFIIFQGCLFLLPQLLATFPIISLGPRDSWPTLYRQTVWARDKLLLF